MILTQSIFLLRLLKINGKGPVTRRTVCFLCLTVKQQPQYVPIHFPVPDCFACVLKDFHEADSQSVTILLFWGFFYRLRRRMCRHHNVSPQAEAPAVIKMSIIVMRFLGEWQLNKLNISVIISFMWAIIHSCGRGAQMFNGFTNLEAHTFWHTFCACKV